MLWHIVRLKWKADTTEEAREKLEHELLEMGRAIPSVRLYRVTRSINDDDTSLVISGFDDKEGLQSYLDDPRHQAVSVQVQERRDGDRVRVDAWTDDPTDVLERIG